MDIVIILGNMIKLLRKVLMETAKCFLFKNVAGATMLSSG